MHKQTCTWTSCLFILLTIRERTYAIWRPLFSMIMRVHGFPSDWYRICLWAASFSSTTSPLYSTTTSPLQMSRLAKAQTPAPLGSLGTLWICEMQGWINFIGMHKGQWHYSRWRSNNSISPERREYSPLLEELAEGLQCSLQWTASLITHQTHTLVGSGEGVLVVSHCSPSGRFWRLAARSIHVFARAAICFSSIAVDKVRNVKIKWLFCCFSNSLKKDFAYCKIQCVFVVA